MNTKTKTPDRKDYRMLVDRVQCSGKLSADACILLDRILRHRNPETGQCNPGIKLLAKRLYPTLTPASGYAKVERHLAELRANWIMDWQIYVDASSDYDFNFDWGTKKWVNGERGT